MIDFKEKLARRMLRSHAKIDEVDLTVLDYLVSHYQRFDRTGWMDAIARGMVEYNGVRSDGTERLKIHDCVAFFPGDLPEPEADLAFRTVYEDADLMVFDKPGNLCVHPTGAFFRHTLWHLAGEQYGELRFVSRLDRETSGLVAAARNAATAAWLETHPGSLEKEYLALVFGEFPEHLRAAGWLMRDEASAIGKKRRFATDLPENAEHPESAETEFFRVQYFGGKSLVRARLFTGRQHQIRATLCSLGYPVVGDKLYGTDESVYNKIRTQSITPEDYEKLGMKRQALHAAKLTITHPATGEKLSFQSPLPEDVKAAMPQDAAKA